MVLWATQVKLGLPLFLFEAFDETNKVQDGGAGAIGAVVENNWGLFTENGTVKYVLPCSSITPSTSPASSAQPSASPGTSSRPSAAPTQPPASSMTSAPATTQPGTLGAACAASAQWMASGGCAGNAAYYAKHGVTDCSSMCQAVRYLATEPKEGGKCSSADTSVACPSRVTVSGQSLAAEASPAEASSDGTATPRVCATLSYHSDVQHFRPTTRLVEYVFHSSV
jgi:hypothetical protein